MPPASLDFVTALGNCIAGSAYPHPVTARNAGLVPAWLSWIACQGGAAGILLGPLELPEYVRGVQNDVSPHWRRGHFRMQPHGPHQSLRKVIFIAPTLVRADRLNAK